MTMATAPTAPARLRIGVKNTQDGGVDGADAGRLDRQLQIIADQRLDVIGFVEAKGWSADGNRILHRVENRLGLRGFLVPSNHHDCGLALFIRPEAGIRVVRDLRDVGPPWWHGINELEVVIDGFAEPVWLLLTHLAPSSPTLRRCEAEGFGLYKRRQVIALLDANAEQADGPDPDLTGIDPEHAARKLDRRPARTIEAAGFIDVAAHVGDRTATVGHTKADRLAFVCDRVYLNRIDPELITGYQVVTDDGCGTGPDSDHRLVVAELRRPSAVAT